MAVFCYDKGTIGRLLWEKPNLKIERKAEIETIAGFL